MQPEENETVVIPSYGVDGDFFVRFFEALTGSLNFSPDSFFGLISTIWSVYSVIAFAVSALFIFGIIYAYIRMNQLAEIEEEALLEQEKMWRELHDGHIENQRWQSVQIHLESENPNDWKLAIIEADVLLERMLEKAGYAGNTVGEKLKSASMRSFSTLDDAWQAHRVRNQIAHGGSDFVLTQKVAKDTLVLYERVFREFDVI